MLTCTWNPGPGYRYASHQSDIPMKISPFTSFYELVDERLWIKFEQRVKVSMEERPSVISNKVGLFKWYDFDTYRYVVELDDIHHKVKCINKV